MKKNEAFTLISFAAFEWDDYLSVQLPFELPVQMPVQLLLELELNLLVQNVISAGGARALPEFENSEERTEKEIENPLLQAPLDLKSYLQRWWLIELEFELPRM